MHRVIFIASSGGHLSEILKLESIIKKYNYLLITDKNKVTTNLEKKFHMKYLLNTNRHHIFKYLIYIIINFIKSFYLFFKFKPDLIYTTGAYICVPLCLIAHLFKKKVIFVEVFDRINNPTLTGKILYHIADSYLVQHKEMCTILPKSKFVGGIY